MGFGGFHGWVVLSGCLVKVIADAFNVGFCLIIQRVRPLLVGSSDLVTRCRHFNTACSFGKCPRARMALW